MASLTNPVKKEEIVPRFLDYAKAVYSFHTDPNVWSANNLPYEGFTFSGWGTPITQVIPSDGSWFVLGTFYKAKIRKSDGTYLTMWDGPLPHGPREDWLLYETGTGPALVDKVAKLYNTHLQRDAEIGGLQYWYARCLTEKFSTVEKAFKAQAQADTAADGILTIEPILDDQGDMIVERVENPIAAYVIWKAILWETNRYTRVRTMNVKLNVTGGGGNKGTYANPGIAFDETKYALLDDSYLTDVGQVKANWTGGIHAINGIMRVEEGYVITAGVLENYFNALKSAWEQVAQSTTADLAIQTDVCHSSCHSSCHGSRGRR